MREEDLVAVFSNIEDIISTSILFYSSLEDLQLRSNYIVAEVGSILKRAIATFICYEKYCSNQSFGSKRLEKLRFRVPKIDAIVRECMKDPRSRGLDLSSFLLTPMQRITRYTLLIKQIRKYTLTNAKEMQNLDEACQSLEDLLIRINDRAKYVENQRILKMIYSNLHPDDVRPFPFFNNIYITAKCV